MQLFIVRVHEPLKLDCLENRLFSTWMYPNLTIDVHPLTLRRYIFPGNSLKRMTKPMLKSNIIEKQF